MSITSIKTLSLLFIAAVISSCSEDDDGEIKDKEVKDFLTLAEWRVAGYDMVDNTQFFTPGECFSNLPEEKLIASLFMIRDYKFLPDLTSIRKNRCQPYEPAIGEWKLTYKPELERHQLYIDGDFAASFLIRSINDKVMFMEIDTIAYVVNSLGDTAREHEPSEWVLFRMVH